MAYEIFFGTVDQRRMLAQPAMVFGQACLAIQLARETLVKQLRLQVGELVVLTQAMDDFDKTQLFLTMDRIAGKWITSAISSTSG